MKTMERLRRADGFTLVELLMALFVGAVLLSAVYVAMISGQRSAAGVEKKVAAQQDVRAALEIMALEIGMASYNPNFQPGLWLRGPSVPPNANDCIMVGDQTYKGIQEATPTAITVEMDIAENGNIGDPNEVIRYSYNVADQVITRSTNCGAAEAFLGANPGAPVGTRTVTLINNTAGINNGPNHGTAAVFRYYDSNGVELYPYLGQDPTQVPNIRRIDITLAVQTEEMDAATGQFRQMIYSTSVLVRNHAIN